MIFPDTLYGLVLSGGKSIRMGTDKGLITYHNKPQREYVYDLLAKVCNKTFLSIRPNQLDEVSKKFEFIADEDEFSGPFNGILSAHKKHPKVAWLVLACDLPLMKIEALEVLISKRNRSKLATAFALKENPLPEPLAAIWEAKGLSRALDFKKSEQGTGPRKFLVHHDVELVFPKDDNVLLNANSESEYVHALKLVSSYE
ncbi:molybdenum cofactor guanylyltransferase [Cellulophaga sp. Hel_I_12]|uniref:molybdenum cofactor guanylyltransferase n=1 Tax=Cellulophaga sp. Hel_I_12 TaxID=1249972 RepID=UPI000647ADFA|nr:NTP transferase domain-containing protein [Cellulophaga sp. Hel_I_12]